MSKEVLPVGEGCNLRCTYCYEHDIREANPVQRYNREAVLAGIAKLDEKWSLFGGEPLLLPLPQLDELLKAGFDRWKETGVQTNGTLITPAHIDLFKKYRTYVGISLDGPDDLNDSRWIANVDATRTQTARTHWAIKALCDEAKTTPHLLPSIIVTLHAGNCAKDKFPRFVQWIRDLDAMGIKSINPHVMELDADAGSLYLSQDELSDRLIDLWNLEQELTQLRFTKFAEVLKLLQGDDTVSCTWHACDPHNTAAVQSIEHDGTPSLCARTFKTGQRWLPAEGSGHDAPLIGHPGARYHQRQLALYVTPQEVGGCQGCEYWMMCQGQCPGEGDHGDWRERSHYCLTWKKLFAEGAKRLRAIGKTPISMHKDRLHMEALMYDLWVQGKSPTYAEMIKQHTDCTAKGMVAAPGGYHGDK